MDEFLLPKPGVLGAPSREKLSPLHPVGCKFSGARGSLELNTRVKIKHRFPEP